MKALIVVIIFFTLQALGQVTALEILQKSIKTHDPKNRWEKMNRSFDMSIVRDKMPDRYFKIHLNLPQKLFTYEVKNDTLHHKQGFEGNNHHVFLNGKTQLSETEIKKYDLGKSRTQYLKEVYEYLLLLPMRLRNDANLLANEVTEETFNKKNCYKITVQYEPKTENETWHFFIDKQNFILQGYQFYLKDKTADGEFIYLNDYQEYGGILMARTKRWFWNKDGSFFRTDRILNSK